MAVGLVLLHRHSSTLSQALTVSNLAVETSVEPASRWYGFKSELEAKYGKQDTRTLYAACKKVGWGRGVSTGDLRFAHSCICAHTGRNRVCNPCRSSPTFRWQPWWQARPWCCMAVSGLAAHDAGPRESACWCHIHWYHCERHPALTPIPCPYSPGSSTQ